MPSYLFYQKVKEIFIVILISAAIFFCIDFFFGKKILDFLYTNNIILSPEKIISQAREIKEKEKSYRIKNEHFHHTLASNIRVQSRWGNSKPYLTCTDKFGFRISCIEKNNKRKNQAVGFKTFFSFILRKYANSDKNINDRAKNNKQNNDETWV